MRSWVTQQSPILPDFQKCISLPQIPVAFCGVTTESHEGRVLTHYMYDALIWWAFWKGFLGLVQSGSELDDKPSRDTHL